ncbi:hypothetical protein CF326_g7169 [Tilletia indica]|nr:hypothetical protein CF326_g7169 [Tilletia indica]
MTCGVALEPFASTIVRHLERAHDNDHRPADIKTAIEAALTAYKDYGLNFPGLNMLQVQPDGTRVPHLAIQTGYGCSVCEEIISRNQIELDLHRVQEHNGAGTSDAIPIQSWTKQLDDVRIWRSVHPPSLLRDSATFETAQLEPLRTVLKLQDDSLLLDYPGHGFSSFSSLQQMRRAKEALKMALSAWMSEVNEMIDLIPATLLEPLPEAALAADTAAHVARATHLLTELAFDALLVLRIRHFCTFVPAASRPLLFRQMGKLARPDGPTTTFPGAAAFDSAVHALATPNHAVAPAQARSATGEFVSALLSDSASTPLLLTVLSALTQAHDPPAQVLDLAHALWALRTTMFGWVSLTYQDDTLPEQLAAYQNTLSLNKPGSVIKLIACRHADTLAAVEDGNLRRKRQRVE